MRSHVRGPWPHPPPRKLGTITPAPATLRHNAPPLKGGVLTAPFRGLLAEGGVGVSDWLGASQTDDSNLLL